MVSIDELLQVAYENGASDVHITVGVPPKYRVNGALLDMNYPRLMGEDTDVMIKSILSSSNCFNPSMTSKQYILFNSNIIFFLFFKKYKILLPFVKHFKYF